MSLKNGAALFVAVGLLAIGFLPTLWDRAEAQIAPNGQDVFQKNCTTCHGADPRAPTLDAFHQFTPEQVIQALIGGAMSRQGSHLSASERLAVAEFVTGKKFSQTVVDPNAGRCTQPIGKFDANLPNWNGWGNTVDNMRYASKGGISAADLPNLKLKWAFGFPDADTAWSQPTVMSGRVYVGSQTGSVYALDENTGCIFWTFEAKGGVRSSVLIGPRIAGHGQTGGHNAYFTDMSGYLHAVDADTGKEVWEFHIEMHPESRMTGPPALYQDRLYVPSASFEEVSSGDPRYECCTFRGSLTSVDTATGKVMWRFYPISKKPVEIGLNTQGTKRFGPSGGGIWGAPAIDAQHNRIYIGVGNTYSGEDQPLTDAVVALDMKTGKILWSFKGTQGDVFVAGARFIPSDANYTNGPDFDFGAAVVYGKLPNGRGAIFAGAKSGIGYALDADNGKLLWLYRAGWGGTNGGMEWGTSYDGKNVYFPVNDVNHPIPGGLHAVDAMTGERVWFAPPPTPLCAVVALAIARSAAPALPPATSGDATSENDSDDAGPARGTRGGANSQKIPNRNCNTGQSAAITIIPGAVLSGALDGGLRAYSTKDGSLLWTYDANRSYTTINGVLAKGSSFIGPGPVVVGGMLFLDSGYGSHNGRPGNVLLAFGMN